MTYDDYLANEYRLRLEYLQSHFSRMLTRFSFLLAINSALLGFSFNDDYANAATSLSSMGLLLSGFWWYYGRVDDFMAKVYREQTDTIHKALKSRINGGSCCQRASLHPAGSLANEAISRIQPKFPEGRPWNHLGPTSFVAIFPMLFILLWFVRLFMEVEVTGFMEALTCALPA